MSAEDDDPSLWRTPAFRQSIHSKIEETIRASPNTQCNDAAEMEDHAFSTATTKDQYLSMVAYLMDYIRGDSERRSAPTNENLWKTPALRENVRAKIEWAIRNSPSQSYENAVEMENQAFMRSSTREQYLSYVSRITKHIRGDTDEISDLILRELEQISSSTNGDRWKTPNFRRLICSKIDEAIRNSPNQHRRTAADMENTLISRAKSKEEYLSFVARLVIRMTGSSTNADSVSFEHGTGRADLGSTGRVGPPGAT
ncbi:uncharacterized protein LOC111262397 [Varroa jacobsoni]|uniref:Mediator of RNA polymerase II transcription subunit 15 n=1 Tax=Varroa destructor TaxID=109461 RepID=A0A7M7KK61_VARDE|nr:uncharacterized protein LOC111252533 [Varroa destructor]XP_022692369.1 uncharacterized protein LOC111262397 [Varroa jacobsoni]